MDNIENLQNYIAYLNVIQEELNKFFDKQKEFLCCQKGCGKCCHGGQFHYSQIEITYLLTGYMKLDKETQNIIDKNIEKIIEEKKIFKGKTFKYNCPFLIDNVCSVYQYRGLICRSFGLMVKDPTGKINVPFCAYEGLSYSDVLDPETNSISEEKLKQGNYKEQPLGFNVGYNYLTGEELAERYNIIFGEKKPMIEWWLNN